VKTVESVHWELRTTVERRKKKHHDELGTEGSRTRSGSLSQIDKMGTNRLIGYTEIGRKCHENGKRKGRHHLSDTAREGIRNLSLAKTAKERGGRQADNLGRPNWSQ